jgi:hypothetical protein
MLDVGHSPPGDPAGQRPAPPGSSILWAAWHFSCISFTETARCCSRRHAGFAGFFFKDGIPVVLITDSSCPGSGFPAACFS